MARALCGAYGLVHLDLDSVAWAEPGVRLPFRASVDATESLDRTHRAWVAKGSYASLARAALPLCTELRFLNPGVEACLENCRRPWEPEKYPSAEAQNERLPFLLDWVRSYVARDDEYGLAQHRAVSESFDGPRTGITYRDDALLVSLRARFGRRVPSPPDRVRGRLCPSPHGRGDVVGMAEAHEQRVMPLVGCRAHPLGQAASWRARHPQHGHGTPTQARPPGRTGWARSLRAGDGPAATSPSTTPPAWP